MANNEGVYVFPDAMAKASGIDPNLLLALQNGGMNEGNWIWILFLWMMWQNGGYNGFRKGKIKAVTCSNPLRRSSIVIIGQSDDIVDFLNSIMHEAEHVKQHMLEYYSVEDSGEPPAYTVGYLVGRMYEGFKKLI